MPSMEEVEVTVVCCGAPKRGMGWYHCKQLLDGNIEGARLAHVVEPWFLGGGKDSAPAKEFAEWAAGNPSVAFHASVEEVPAGKAGCPRLVIICGRTADNPRLFKAAIDNGYTHVYLEKPGAPSVAELQEMAAYANSKSVPVFMGYNRNFSKYILAANAELAKAPAGSSLVLGRNDCFNTPEALDECFERNAEGMMKNMMVHELVTLITYHGLTCEVIDKVTANSEYTAIGHTEYTVIETRRGFTDFSKVGFTITTKSGQEFVLWGDRTDGEFGEAIVKYQGKELFKAIRPDVELLSTIKEAEAALPGCMPYFYLQDAEYRAVKEAVVKSILFNSERPKGVAGIDTAIESVRLCDKLTETLMTVPGLQKKPAAGPKAKAKGKARAKGKAVAKDIKKRPARK